MPKIGLFNACVFELRALIDVIPLEVGSGGCVDLLWVRPLPRIPRRRRRVQAQRADRKDPHPLAYISAYTFVLFMRTSALCLCACPVPRLSSFPSFQDGGLKGCTFSCWQPLCPKPVRRPFSFDIWVNRIIPACLFSVLYRPRRQNPRPLEIVKSKPENRLVGPSLVF